MVTLQIQEILADENDRWQRISSGGGASRGIPCCCRSKFAAVEASSAQQNHARDEETRTREIFLYQFIFNVVLSIGDD